MLDAFLEEMKIEITNSNLKKEVASIFNPYVEKNPNASTNQLLTLISEVLKSQTIKAENEKEESNNTQLSAYYALWHMRFALGGDWIDNFSTMIKNTFPSIPSAPGMARVVSQLLHYADENPVNHGNVIITGKTLIQESSHYALMRLSQFVLSEKLENLKSWIEKSKCEDEHQFYRMIVRFAYEMSKLRNTKIVEKVDDFVKSMNDKPHKNNSLSFEIEGSIDYVGDKATLTLRNLSKEALEEILKLLGTNLKIS